MTIFGTKLVNVRLVMEFKVSVTLMDKIYNFALNSNHLQQIHYFRHAEKNYWPPGRGWTSIHVQPLNTPLLSVYLYVCIRCAQLNRHSRRQDVSYLWGKIVLSII